MPWTIDIPEPEVALDLDCSLSADAGGRYPQRIDPDRSGLAEMSEFYRQLGFEAGYGQAARDQLEFSVAIAEQILQEHSRSLNGAKDARRLLYSFIARIDRRLSLLAGPVSGECSEEQMMEGGLGI